MTKFVIGSYGYFSGPPKPPNTFEVDFEVYEANRMYPLRSTARMSRADFIAHKLYQRLSRKPRKES